MERNLILATDSYKACHPFMYPAGFDGSFAYLEARGGYTETVFFGLQAFIKDYLLKPVTMEDVEEAASFFAAHGTPFPRAGWERIVHTHGGYLPIRIKGLPEGSVVPTRIPLLTVESTDPVCAWIVGWVETMILRAIWYPTTVCTNSWKIRQALKPLIEKSCANPAEIVTKVSDFGARGVSSGESAMLGGAAHLVNFNRTATVEAVRMVNRYYGTRDGMAAKAIPSAEHGAILSWGADREADAYEHILNGFAKPGAVISVVSDSYDYYETVKNLWCGKFVDQVKASGGILAIRPDSGDPVGTTIRTLAMLASTYGVVQNEKGFNVLNNVRVVWGDGLTPEKLINLAEKVVECGFSLTNVFFGMGGGLLQQVHRDEGKFAYKMSAARVNGEWRGVQKTVKTDPGKASKAGRLAVTKSNGTWACVEEHLITVEKNLLIAVYENGKLTRSSTMDEIRERANG